MIQYISVCMVYGVPRRWSRTRWLPCCSVMAKMTCWSLTASAAWQQN